ncbi:hypothetical protein [uncultured Roseobacter sp.]|uniref:hypothetical protein n=1 Tax=uncultured Roseobacter sp. TaxID=114847 RepID=UPI00261E1C68|nr:hypothetical protein [uncultured Roseobacter sp.]
MKSLDARLIAAHERGDKKALVALYTTAADSAETADAAAFFLTHAYVFALEAGHPDADDLRRRLVEMGRETPRHASDES